MGFVYFSIGLTLALFIIYIKELKKNYIWNKRKQKGLEGEKKAKGFLKLKGYKILDYQYELKYNFYADENKIAVKIRPDYIVQKGFKKYIAEVKTGTTVTNPHYKATRRQLLEYYFAGDFDGILLVDMENKKIKTIFFKNIKLERIKKVNKILIVLLISISILLLGVMEWKKLGLYIMNVKKELDLFLRK